MVLERVCVLGKTVQRSNTCYQLSCLSLKPGNLLENERLNVFIDERSEAECYVARQLCHCFNDFAGQLSQLLFVVQHRVRQVHEKVNVNWVVLGLFVRHGQVRYLTFYL